MHISEHREKLKARGLTLNQPLAQFLAGAEGREGYDLHYDGNCKSHADPPAGAGAAQLKATVVQPQKKYKEISKNPPTPVKIVTG